MAGFLKINGRIIREESVLDLSEGAAPGNTSSVGKYYASSVDNRPHFVSSNNTDYDLTMGGTLDTAYDYGGVGSGAGITADNGAVTITVPLSSNNAGLSVVQSDTNNNPAALTVTNAGSGAAIELAGGGTRKLSSSSADLTVETVTSGVIYLNAADGVKVGSGGGGTLTAGTTYVSILGDDLAGSGYFYPRNPYQSAVGAFLLTGSTSNSVVLCEYADRGFNFGHAAFTSPTFVVQSHNQTTNEWAGFQHNGTSAALFSGKGGFQFQMQADVASGDVFSFDTLGSAEMTATSGTQSFLKVAPEVAQTSTAGYTALEVDVAETSTGSGSNYLADFQVASSSKFSVYNDGVVYMAQTSAPSPTTDKLYNVSGNLYWNGFQLNVDNSTDSRLTSGTAAGQMLFWDGSNSWDPTETSELFWDDSNKRLSIGYNVPEYGLQVNGTTWSAASIGIRRWTADNGPPYFLMGKSRSATPGSFSAISSGDYLGEIVFQGDDGAGIDTAIRIRCIASQAWTASNHGTDFLIYTTTDDTGTAATRYMIDGSTGDHYWYGSGTSPTQIMELFGSGNNEGCLSLNTDGGQTYNGFFVYTASSTALNRANLTLSRSRGTNSSPTAISDGDVIGELSIDGCHTAGDYITAAYFRATAAGNWTSSSFPADVSIFVNAGTTGYTTPILTLTNEGRVGIKEISPLYGLHLTGGSTRSDSSVVLENFTATGGGGPIINFRSAAGSAGTPTAVLDNHNLAYIVGTGYDGTNYKTGALMQFIAEENWDGSGCGAEISFSTVANNTTTTTQTLRIRHDGSVYMSQVYGDTVTSSRDLEIQSDGKIGYVSSATRYKENVQAYTDASWIHDLPVKTFTYIADAPGGEIHYGFLAEDLEELNSDLVFYEGAQIEGIHYKRLIPVAVRAIQELKIETDVYGDRLDALDGRYAFAAGGGHAWYNTAEIPDKVLEVTDAGSLYAFQTYNDTVVNGRDLMIQSDGKIGYESSAKRYKKYIKTMDDTQWLSELRPVTFRNRKDSTNELQYGLIAEEVEEVNGDFVFYDEDYKIEGVHYKKFIPVLIKAQQEQRKEALSLEETVADLEQKIVDLQKKLSKLSSKGR